ncbi:MAG: hypothetical protein V1857_00610 [archaeon]
MSTDLGIDWNQTNFPKEDTDAAAKIVEQSVQAQKRALVDFKGDPRLPRSAMPTHNEIHQFAEQLAGLTGYRILDESRSSGVVLLSKLKHVKKFG